MRKQHALHGRDHAANGCDPIPGLGAASYWAYVRTQSSDSISAGTTFRVQWDAFRTNLYYAAVASGGSVPAGTGFYTYNNAITQTNTSGDDWLYTDNNSITLVHARARWASGVTAARMRIVTTDNGLWTEEWTSSYVDTFFYTDGTGKKYQRDSRMIIDAYDDTFAESGYNGRGISLDVTNDDGSSRTLEYAELLVFRWDITAGETKAYGTDF